jgi:hypothetical protein
MQGTATDWHVICVEIRPWIDRVREPARLSASDVPAVDRQSHARDEGGFVASQK